ncbi:5990_t:CDS:2 [Scutellospora calospora]|uniref:5990_t:CDS:1 n=1 Tax=Scutellospora calospora TaxID=85575 RepID=A0ACA9JV86_9GLOM|nr:5990_t:CDS:2 [Scutellospora calospora]
MENFELHDYQKEAAKKLADKHCNYQPIFDLQINQPIPLIQSLVSVTGSGKTAILAQTGKYQSLLPPQTQIKPFLEIAYEDIANFQVPLIYVDTVQKFSVENKESRKIYQLEADKGDKSQKALELNPQGIILSSGTPSYPARLKPYLEKLEKQRHGLITAVSFQRVKARQMVKSKVVLGGYNHPMHEVINEMLGDWQELSKLAAKENLPIPKIIYVCKTNLLELEAKKARQRKRDNPQVPFSQRQAPPILI